MNSFLFIVNSFPPINNQNSIRALELSKRLIKENIKPLILTRRDVVKEAKDYDLIKEIPHNLEVLKTRVIELKKRYSLRTFFFKISLKIFNTYFFIHWIPFGYLVGKRILKERKNIKFIYSTGPPNYSHIIAYLLKKKFKLPLIVEYRDPWSFNPYGSSKKLNLFQKTVLKIERKVLNSATILITVSEALKLFLIEKFPDIKSKPIFIIENGLNLEEIANYENKNKDKIIFTFIGKLYGRRNIEPLLQIISDLKRQGIFKNIEFLLKIFGKYSYNSLTRIIKKLDIQDLVYLGEFLTRKQIYEEIKKSYLTIHVGEDLDYPTISFKVWDYLSCRKKILYLGREDSYTANFLMENNFGVVISINNLKKSRDTIKKIFLDINNNKFSNIIDKEKIMTFSWDNKVKKLKLCIEKLIR